MFSFFFFNDTATTEIYTLSLHDALPIWLLLPDVEVEVRLQDRPPLADLHLLVHLVVVHRVVQELLRQVGDLRVRSEEHTSELQSQSNLVCRLLLEKKKKTNVPLRQSHTH